MAKRYWKYSAMLKYSRTTNKNEIVFKFCGKTDDLQGAIETFKKYPTYGFKIIDKETNTVVFEDIRI